MSVITAERLVKLAYNFPNLYNNWYIIAAVSLSVANQPEEIGKVLHFAVRQQLLDSQKASRDLLKDTYMLKLAEDSISFAKADGAKTTDVLIPEAYRGKLPLPLKYSGEKEIHEVQFRVAQRIREALLKSAPIGALPKAIASSWALYPVTPAPLRAAETPSRPAEITPGSGSKKTLEGPIGPESVNTEVVSENFAKGSAIYSKIYGDNTAVSQKSLNDAYPDLWRFTHDCVYSSIMSFEDILNVKETSYSIVSSLVPLDVPVILKGHTRGAHNAGASKDEMTSLRLTLLDICDWSGVSWKGGRESVNELFAPYE